MADRARTKARIGVLGASGYTGAELVRLLIRHPQVEIALLTAERRAGREMREVFPQFSPFALPRLQSVEGIDWVEAGLDLIFCALPHATTQQVVEQIFASLPAIKVVDLSADFRLADTSAYARWYGHEHRAPELQRQAAYGLVETHREEIRHARLVANPGCYTTCAQLPLVPLLRAQAFSRRYYEAFDLARSLLVEFDSRHEAQKRETGLHRKLRAWNAVQPLTVPDAAAGKTEWYRGAYALIRSELETDRAAGNVTHLPALAWWQGRLETERERLYEWASRILRYAEGATVTDDARALMADALDAYPALGVPLDDALPAGVRHLIARDRLPRLP